MGDSVGAIKLLAVRLLQKYLVNPPVKLAFRLGAIPPGYALLETVGRTSGEPRRTPVGDGLVGDTFWIVAEHGTRAGYVRNIVRNPRVRVRVRSKRGSRWRSGTAHVLPDEDVRERQRAVAAGRPGRALNAFMVRAMGTELLVVRVDLDPGPT